MTEPPMTAGLPGTGIGGLFYLLCVLVMPVAELSRAVAGRPGRWLLVVQQSLMGYSILGGISLLGVLLTLVVPLGPAGSTAAGGLASRQKFFVALGRAGLMLSLGTLAVVLLSVRMLQYLTPPRTRQPSALTPAVRSSPRHRRPTGVASAVQPPSPLPPSCCCIHSLPAA